jgi:hypothetical protein
MAQRRDLFPGWVEQDWLPVAGDGCGNCYVLTADGIVGFIDTMKDPAGSTVRSQGTCCPSWPACWPAIRTWAGAAGDQR